MNGIIRSPTEEERKNFIPIVDPAKRKLSIEDEFKRKLGEEQQKAQKKGLPFCERAAKDDFYEGYQTQAKTSLKLNGYVKAEDIKPVEINWAKYSDLKNFELMEEGEVNDEYLTKKNPGLDVNVKKAMYKFKGYSNTYTMMEDASSAIRRARQKLKDLEIK
jgi:hypothetical protein